MDVHPNDNDMVIPDYNDHDLGVIREGLGKLYNEYVKYRFGDIQ